MYFTIDSALSLLPHSCVDSTDMYKKPSFPPACVPVDILLRSKNANALLEILDFQYPLRLSSRVPLQLNRLTPSPYNGCEERRHRRMRHRKDYLRRQPHCRNRVDHPPSPVERPVPRRSPPS